MALRIQIAKFKVHQYLLRGNSPNLMIAKLSRYMVIYMYHTPFCNKLIAGQTGKNASPESVPWRSCAILHYELALCFFPRYPDPEATVTFNYTDINTLSYSGKLSREKTFVDQWENFHGSVRNDHFVEKTHRKLKSITGGYGMPKFHGENFCG